MFSFHENVFRFCPNRRPKSHPIGLPVIFRQQPPLDALGTRVLAAVATGKVSGTCAHFSDFGDFCGCYTFWNENPPETVYRADFRKIQVGDTLRAWFGFG
jgi:hypothetical protein